MTLQLLGPTESAPKAPQPEPAASVAPAASTTTTSNGNDSNAGQASALVITQQGPASASSAATSTTRTTSTAPPPAPTALLPPPLPEFKKPGLLSAEWLERSDQLFPVRLAKLRMRAAATGALTLQVVEGGTKHFPGRGPSPDWFVDPEDAKLAAAISNGTAYAGGCQDASCVRAG
jgi:hypothetical protein